MKTLISPVNKEKIYKSLRQSMSDERYQHTIGVMYTAASLAMCYEQHIEQAMLAGLLHDCAKTDEFSEKRLLEICQKHDLPISVSEEKKPALLHSKVGALLAANRFGVEDKAILNAITWHTTGRPEMTILDKIIYIADYIEPNRYKARNLPVVRRLAYQNLDECLYQILQDSMAYLESTKGIIDPLTEETYRYYREKLVK